MNKSRKTSFDFPAHSTPLMDCSGLIPLWVNQLSDLNRVEAENILQAQRKYLTGAIPPPQKWFKVTMLRVIHESMFGDVWSWAGQFRTSVTSIGVKPAMIPSMLAALCHEICSWNPSLDNTTLVEMSAKVHHKLVFIHPFENGNGRFSRFIADRFLLAYKCPSPIWPDNLYKEGILRNDYIQTLKSADKGDYAPLVALMHKLGAKDLVKETIAPT